MTKGYELKLADTLRGEILMEYLNVSKQLKTNYRPTFSPETEINENEGRIVVVGLTRHKYTLKRRKRRISRSDTYTEKTVDFYSLVLAFKRWDTMKTIHPANIG